MKEKTDLSKANYRVAKGTCATCIHNNRIQTDANEVGCDLFEVWVGAWMACDNQIDRE